MAGEGDPAGGECGDEDDGGDEAEDSAERTFENRIWVSTDVEEVEVGKDQALGTGHPDAQGGEAEHDGIVYGDSCKDEERVNQHMRRRWTDTEMVESECRDEQPQGGIDDIVGAELSCGDGELGIDRLGEEEVQFSGSHEFRQVGEVDVENGLEELRDELVSADECDDVPASPVADDAGVAEEGVDEEDLASEPEEFDERPKEEVGLEVHLPDEGVAEQQEVNLEVAAEGGHGVRVRKGCRRL